MIVALFFFQDSNRSPRNYNGLNPPQVDYRRSILSVQNFLPMETYWFLGINLVGISPKYPITSMPTVPQETAGSISLEDA